MILTFHLAKETTALVCELIVTERFILARALNAQ
jgi:hypothetical protein